MKIAVIYNPVYPVPPKKYGGTERLIYYLIKGLSELGVEVTLYGTADSKVDGRLIPFSPAAIPYDNDPRINQVNLSQREKLLGSMWARLRDEKGNFDVIHAVGIEIPEDLRQTPHLITFDHNPNLLNIQQLETSFRNQILVSVSKSQQQNLPDLSYMGYIYNSLDPDVYPIVTKPEEYLLFIGRIGVDKQPHLAMELAIAMNRQLKYIGKKELIAEDYLKLYARDYLGNPLLDYLGEMGDREKAPWIANAAVNLHPINFREPFGLTVVEAGYCGTPTIAMNRGSMPELIEDGKNGILVEDYVLAANRFSEAIRLDRAVVAESFRSRFHYKRMANKYKKAYEIILERELVKHVNNQDALKLAQEKLQSET